MINQNLSDIVKSFDLKFLPNAIYRWEDCLDKSSARLAKFYYKANFKDEFNSLCLDTKEKIRDKALILIDDFTTSGMSLESGRNLLERSDIDTLVIGAFGKYNRPVTKHSIYEVNTMFDPFCEYNKVKNSKDYSLKVSDIQADYNSQSKIVEYFDRLSKE